MRFKVGSTLSIKRIAAEGLSCLKLAGYIHNAVMTISARFRELE